ncbi:hypothetical protein AAV35_002180 [Salimicrobium jeotgali]|uniref:Uncharacterized protein n=1 Tax=Salimicrobium jeotgali TaxID=1230341 RepID=K2H6P1_9BACI|nr:hypothetical protein [Salimicrobium jeotgali]AKG03713.1 hypothetical protein AAV35_002180 [Salimicrobium jeotgali]EKE31435.1 hypothetical protein MJ3_08676 [Salimicrobium jeotgali]MBM7697045.1 hypothetical protein [Salimicrobium jeotgali]
MKLKELHPVTWVIIALILIFVPSWLYMNYGLIHEEHVKEATVSEKYHEKDEYYIVADGKDIKLSDSSQWMLIEPEEKYEITYEWYGQKEPEVVSINQAHDDDSTGGGH